MLYKLLRCKRCIAALYHPDEVQLFQFRQEGLITAFQPVEYVTLIAERHAIFIAGEVIRTRICLCYGFVKIRLANETYPETQIQHAA